jgi:hypothetical protein
VVLLQEQAAAAAQHIAVLEAINKQATQAPAVADAGKIIREAQLVKEAERILEAEQAVMFLMGHPTADLDL